MIKTFSPGDQDELLAKVDGKLFTFFDEDTHIKRAASSAISEKLMRENAPDKDHYGAHIIIMGSSEWYSFNKNGDFWPDKELQARHNTFVKYGHYFLEHDHLDPKKAIGIIKASAYNPDLKRLELIIHGDKVKDKAGYERAKAGKENSYSMSARVPFDQCCAKGTLILTPSGYKPIETLMVGDEVITHKHNLKKITKLFHSSKPKPGKTIIFGNTDFPITLTDTHPVFALTAGDCSSNQKNFIRKIKTGDVVTGIKNWNTPAFVDAGSLSPGDYMLLPVPEGTVESAVDPWLLGIFLADGCIVGNRAGRKKRGAWSAMGVTWTFGYAKNEVRDRLVKLITLVGNTPHVRHYPEKHCFVVSWGDSLWAREILRICGKTKNKHLPAGFQFWKPSHLRLLLAGWLDGDGCLDTVKNTMRGGSSLDMLTRELLLATFYAGAPATHHTQVTTSNFQPKPTLTHSLAFASTHTKTLVDFTTRFKIIDEKLKPNPRLFYIQHNNLRYIALRVGDLVSQTLKETFNFSVDQDESYIAEFAAVHNCSICDHEAKASKFYCTHLKNSMTQYLPKYKKFAYAINVRPTFFDASRVKNPADRIAHHIEYSFNDQEEMKKAASTGNFVFSDELAERAGVRQLAEPLDPMSEIMLKKLAATEAYIQEAHTRPGYVSHDEKFQFLKSAAACAFGAPVMTDAQLDVLRAMDTEVLFHEMAKRASLLPFLDFYAYITDQTIKASSEDPIYIEAANQHLEGLFGDLLEHPEAGDIFDLFKSASSTKMAFAEVQNESERIFEKLAQHYSLLTESVRARALYNEPKEVVIVKSASVLQVPEDVSKAKFLARSYGLYKLAFCDAVSYLHGAEFLSDPVMILVTTQK